MNTERLFKLVNNYAKRRENVLKMPANQKHIVQPALDTSTKELEEEINSIIDERITSYMEKDIQPGDIISLTDKGSDETKEDDTAEPENKNSEASESEPGDDDKPPEIF